MIENKWIRIKYYLSNFMFNWSTYSIVVTNNLLSQALLPLMFLRFNLIIKP